MTQQSKPKILTHVEVIIIVFICIFVFVLILGIVLPPIYKTRNASYRMTCGMNLSHIGKAMQVYAKDYDNKYPRAGGESSAWSSRISHWVADDRNTAYDLNHIDGSGGAVSITSSFYLLIKHAEAAPKIFICPGDKGTTVFKPADYGANDKELADFWDFGPYKPREHCSFSYHIPYGDYPLTTSSEPGMAVAADPNPWIGSPSVKGKDPSLLASYNPDGYRKETNNGNAVTHKKEGQNVLFMDTHVGFQKRPFCAVNDDNIYTFWDGGDIRRGGLPIPKGSAPRDKLDSFLVNDFP